MLNSIKCNFIDSSDNFKKPDCMAKYSIILISYIIVGFEVIKEAFENIKEGEIFDENFLMTIATVGALIIGEFPEAVAVMIFYNVGEMFEEIATDKSKNQ